VLVLFALGLLIGVGVDGAHTFILRNRLTAIADDAALAGASQLDVDAWRRGELALDPVLAQAAAERILAADGEPSGTVISDDTGVTVQVSEQMPTVVLRLVGIGEITVRALAHATPKTP
jgi:Flp pilus assembly protein TadG